MSTTVNEGLVSTHRIPLEQAAQEFADATANPPFLYELGPEKGREVVNQTQAGEIAKPKVTDEWIKVPGGPDGDVSVRIVPRPEPLASCRRSCTSMETGECSATQAPMTVSSAS